MDTAERAGGKVWTADTFLAADQHDFGGAWRYELVDGRIVVHAAPSPDHGSWSFEAIDGLDAVLHLNSVCIELPLAEVYEFVALEGEAEDAHG